MRKFLAILFFVQTFTRKGGKGRMRGFVALLLFHLFFKGKKKRGIRGFLVSLHFFFNIYL